MLGFDGGEGSEIDMKSKKKSYILEVLKKDAKMIEKVSQKHSKKLPKSTKKAIQKSNKKKMRKSMLLEGVGGRGGSVFGGLRS